MKYSISFLSFSYYFYDFSVSGHYLMQLFLDAFVIDLRKIYSNQDYVHIN